MHNFYNFPEYLRHNAKWAVWRYEQEDGKAKPSKPPRHPVTGKRIATTEPDTWASFDEAAAAFGDGAIWSGIGFLIEKRLGVTVIDLDYKDNRPSDIQVLHTRIYEQMQSYTEFSPSGMGLHIVCGGVVQTARKFDVEVYSDVRFMTVTGNVLYSAGIVDCQWKLEKLVEEIIGEQGKVVEGSLENECPQVADDAEILARAYAAANGAKFQGLWEGQYLALGFPSQSEADFALINMLCYYTQNVVQIRRMFFASALGQRDKLLSRPELLNKMIRAGFDRLVPEIDMSALRAKFEAMLQAQQTAQTMPAVVEASGHVVSDAIAPPPGLLGQVCQWFYQAAPYPAPEVALAGGLAFMAGLCGAGYRVAGEPLNLFLLLTAPSGTGKDILTSGSHRLLKAAAAHPSMFTGTKLNAGWINILIGPSNIASGQALTKHIKEDFMSTVSIQPEFGIELQRLSDPYASGAIKALRSAYLKLSGSHILGKEIWADTDKNMESRQGIAFTLLGESVPQKIYDNLSVDDFGDGFIGRLMVIECKETREHFQAHAYAMQPDPAFVEAIIAVGSYASERARMREPAEVHFSPAAKAIADAHRVMWRKRHSGSNVAPQNAIWARCYVKAVRLSALVAVGKDFRNPVIEAEDFEWAADVVERGTLAVTDKFNSGEIAEAGDVDGLKVMQDFLKKYAEGKSGLSGKYYKPEFQKAGQIAKSHLHMFMSCYKAFKKDKTAYERCFKMLLESGSVVMVMDKSKQAAEFNGSVIQITKDVFS